MDIICIKIQDVRHFDDVIIWLCHIFRSANNRFCNAKGMTIKVIIVVCFLQKKTHGSTHVRALYRYLWSGIFFILLLGTDGGIRTQF